MRNLVLVAVMAMASVVPAAAEDAVAPAPDAAPGVCWLGGLAFSVGSNMRAGDGVSSCLADGRWKLTTGPALGCLKDGKLFTLGSSAGIGDAKNSKQTCRKDGTWT